MKQSEVISELKELIINQLERVYSFQEEESKLLSTSPDPNSWNVLQCLEHLNRYSEFYTNSIGSKLKSASKKGTNYQELEFKAGYFGNKFYLDMLPKEDGSIKKMKTFKSKNPTQQEANSGSLENFISYQEDWLKVLDAAKSFNLNKNNCKLTIPLIKMNLGSTLKFVIAHQERHLQQAERALAAAKL